MIPINTAWTNYIKDYSVYNIIIEMTFMYAGGQTVSIEFGSDDIVEGSLQLKQGICDIGEFNLGGGVASELHFTLVNFDGRFDNLNFSQGVATVHVMMPSYSSLLSGDYITLGQFYMDDQKSIGRTIPMVGYDAFGTSQTGMNKPLPNDFSIGTAVNTIVSACQYCADTITTQFPNYNYSLPSITVDATWTPRQIVKWVAELCGCYAFYSSAMGYYNADYPSDYRGTTVNNGICIQGFKSYIFTDFIDGGSFTPVEFSLMFVDGVAYYDGNLGTISKSGYTITFSQDGLTYVGNTLTLHDPIDITFSTSTKVAVATVDDGTEYSIKADDLDGGGFYELPAGDNADGGYFTWLDPNLSAYNIEDATEVKKIMDIPQTNAGRMNVTGVSLVAYDDGTIVTVGDDSGYCINIEGNPFIVASNINAVASMVYSQVGGVNFVPFSLSCIADPHIEVGDLVRYNDNGITRGTILTSYDITIGGICNMACESHDESSTQF